MEENPSLSDRAKVVVRCDDPVERRLKMSRMLLWIRDTVVYDSPRADEIYNAALELLED